jgi:hypothetical protein
MQRDLVADTVQHPERNHLRQPAIHTREASNSSKIWTCLTAGNSRVMVDLLSVLGAAVGVMSLVIQFRDECVKDLKLLDVQRSKLISC